jgi:hypothetical protein
LTRIDASSTTAIKKIGASAMAKEELINVVRRLLREVVKARFEGGAYARLARAHGYADGYMAALLDAGIVERQSLLRLVSEERVQVAALPADAH